MPYKCAFGHTLYNALCDACDSATERTSAYENDGEIKHKAALKGMTKQEYINREEEDERRENG